VKPRYVFLQRNQHLWELNIRSTQEINGARNIMLGYTYGSGYCCAAQSSIMFPMHSSGPCLHSTPSLSVGLLSLATIPNTTGIQNLRADIREREVDLVNDTLHRGQNHHSETILWKVRFVTQSLPADPTFASGHLLMICASRGTRARSWVIVTGVTLWVPHMWWKTLYLDAADHSR
jgi:hypothetical protein